MNLYFSGISKILNEDLEQIRHEYPDVIKKTEHSALCVKTCLQKLKEYICNNPFQNPIEEINFFKETKPSICCKLIFFVEVLKIESRRPIGDRCHHKKYLIKERKKLRSYFNENIEFYKYCRNKSTHLDEKYFLRRKLDLHMFLDDLSFDADPRFSTSHDHKVSRILANDLINNYINDEIQLLDKVDEKQFPVIGKCKFVWSESKIALVELIYALHTAGCVNNGSGDIKEIAHLFEAILNIELGDFYRTFLEIKTRQNPTKFLDTMRLSLIRKIEEQDE